MKNLEIVGQIFGWIGTPMSFILTLSSLKMVRALMKDKDANKMSEVVFISTGIMNVAWINYFTRDVQYNIILPNFFSYFMQTIYYEIFCYYKYKGLTKRIGIMIGAIIIPICLLIGLYYLKAEIVGIIALVLNFLFFLGPLQKLTTVVKTFNYEMLPLTITVAALSCSICYSLYGIFCAKLFVMLPNIFGMIVSLFTIVVYLICKPFKQMKDLLKNKEDQINLLNIQLNTPPLPQQSTIHSECEKVIPKPQLEQNCIEILKDHQKLVPVLESLNQIQVSLDVV